MAKMMKNYVSEEELLKLAKKVNFEVKDDGDLLKLFRTAKSLGWWPEMDLPKLNLKTFWAPKEDQWRIYRKNPFPDPTLEKKYRKDYKKVALAEELEKLTLLADALGGKTSSSGTTMDDLDKWLDEIK